MPIKSIKSIKVKHLFANKTSEFDNENDFISFTKQIMMENGDVMEVNSIHDCITYIKTFCDNLFVI